MEHITSGTKIAFIVYQTDEISDYILGYVVLQIIDEIGHLVHGEYQIGLWSVDTMQKHDDYDFIFRATNCSNKSTESMFVVLTIRFPEFALPVCAAMYFDDIVS